VDDIVPLVVSDQFVNQKLNIIPSDSYCKG